MLQVHVAWENTQYQDWLVCVCAKWLQSCPTLCDTMDCVANKAPLSIGFSR